MARRRYQKGMVFLRGKREKVWVGRWLEDELQPDGAVVRVRKAEVLGSRKDYATKRLAQRELDNRLSVVNSPTYQARPTATFEQFAERWKTTVLPNHKPSSQASEKSDIKAWMPHLKTVQMKDVNTEMLQAVITKKWMDKSPKTVRNRVMTFRTLWNSALQWKYVAHSPCDALVLPEYSRPEQPYFTFNDVQNIIKASKPPYDLVWWLVFETGIRCGELCALNVGSVDLANSILIVRQSRWLKHITSTKSKRPRVFSLSPELVERLKFYVEGRKPEEPLFLTPTRVTKKGKVIGGTRLESNNLVKRHLKPIVKQLGLEGAAHGFRHGNATVLDQLNTPMAVRQARLGHVAQNTTMSYTHLVSADDRKVSATLGSMLGNSCPKIDPSVLKNQKAQEPKSLSL